MIEPLKCKHAAEANRLGILGPICALCYQESIDQLTKEQNEARFQRDNINYAFMEMHRERNEARDEVDRLSALLDIARAALQGVAEYDCDPEKSWTLTKEACRDALWEITKKP